MNIVILGGGPAGLYSALLIKKAHPAHDITIIERNPADVTYGWGVVFSDRTLASFQRADYKTYEQITNHFVLWDAIDVFYRDEILRCGGHVIASIARKHLLHILQRRCAELGIALKFGHEIHDLAQLPACDLLIAADGINSLVRRTYTDHFKPSIEPGKARYIWLGTSKVLDAFTFIFRENEHGLFQVHAYPSSGTTSTFIVECDEASWLRAGLDSASEEESLAYCQRLFAADLNGAALLSNNSKWISFPTLTTRSWHHQHMVLLGDAVHTAHFSIGSGTKLAMEDAIALAGALEQHADLETALNEYELERKPVVEIFQRAARESQAYFETLKRYLGLAPMPFTFQLLTRSGRITYDDLRLRDPRFADTVDRRFAASADARFSSGASHHRETGQRQGAGQREEERGQGPPVHIQREAGRPQGTPVHITIAPPPMFAPFTLRDLTLPNRVVVEYRNVEAPARGALLPTTALTGAGLVMAGPVAISPDGRISPDDAGIYTSEHAAAWAEIVQSIHSDSPAKVGIQLSHAGRRGSTQPRSQGLDRPLREGNWPLLSASPLPYTPQSQAPKEIDQADMDRVRAAFAQAAQMALEANFDLLQLHFAHGYLLASFLSPLTNLRADEYGGDLEQRMRFPLEVFDAVRATWPQERPISVALSVSDYMKGGTTVEDALQVAHALKAHGCDIIAILAGQTTMQSEAAYGRGFLTPLSDRVRNEAAIPTLVGGYLTTSNEVNTILAAGRADLCIMETA